MSPDLEVTPLTLAADTVAALSRILIEVVADGGSVSGGALLGALALVLARRRRRRD